MAPGSVEVPVSGHIRDIIKIAFVYFVLYIPASCVFFQFWGKSGIKAYNDIPSVFFTVFRMIVVDDYAYEDILNWGTEQGIDQSWTHLVISYWLLVSSIILLNLFIALMSDTFQRIYDKAVEVAALERAATIVQLEKKLSNHKRDLFLKYIKKHFAPKILYFEDGNAEFEIDESKHTVRSLTKTLTEHVEELSNLSTSSEQKTETSTDFETTVQSTLEEQEIAMRQVLGTLADFVDPGDFS